MVTYIYSQVHLPASLEDKCDKSSTLQNTLWLAFISLVYLKSEYYLLLATLDIRNKDPFWWVYQ